VLQSCSIGIGEKAGKLSEKKRFGAKNSATHQTTDIRYFTGENGDNGGWELKWLAVSFVPRRASRRIRFSIQPNPALLCSLRFLLFNNLFRLKFPPQTADTSAGCLPTWELAHWSGQINLMLPVGTKPVLQTTETKSDKRRLFRDRRRCAIIFACALAVASVAAAGSGYLACVGPAPLRFREVPPPVTNQVVLAVPDPEPVATIASPAPFGPMPELRPPSSEPPAITNEAASAIPDTTSPEEVVSPQMLLKYFNKSTNGASSSVVMPMGFTPPKSPEPPASKATYSTGP
jgi:hypothetical protein